MLYWHHGINMSFSGDYNEYFSPATNVDAVVYLMLANDLIHNLLPQVTVQQTIWKAVLNHAFSAGISLLKGNVAFMGALPLR